MTSRARRSMTTAENARLRALSAARFYRPLFDVRSLRGAVGLFFALLGLAFLGFLCGTLAALLFFLASKALPGVALFARLSSPAAVKTWLAAGAVIALVGFPLLAARGMQRAETSRRALLRKDLDGGEAEVLSVTATEAIRCEALEEDGEAGPAFFVEVGPAEVLFLQGAYLEDDVRSGRFPCSSFDLVIAPRSRATIDLVCGGDPLPPSTRTFDDLFAEECDLPADGEVVEATLATLGRDLRRRTGRSAGVRAPGRRVDIVK